MKTLDHSVTIPYTKLESFGTSDHRLRDLGWQIVAIGSVHRDSDTVAQSNHTVLCELLEKIDPNQDHWGLLQCNHWAVGWIDHIIVDTEHTELMQEIRECDNALADYPILSDDHHSQLEFDLHCDDSCGSDCSLCDSELGDHDSGRCEPETCKHCESETED